MDWPVIGSLAGVAALAGSVAVGGWLMLGSTTMAIKNPSAPVLLVDTKPPQQSVLYLPPQVRTAQRESVLASVPRSDLLEPYFDRDRPYRRAPVTQHEEISKKPKAYVERPPEPPQHHTLPLVIDERYAHVLTPEKVAQLRRMMHLRPNQTEHWPPVESMLHQIGRIQMAHIRRGEKPDLDSAVMMQLYSAAQPLLSTLAPEQKDKIRSLAKSLGYPNVASLL